jgi:FkbM family methyltransferase
MRPLRDHVRLVRRVPSVLRGRDYFFRPDAEYGGNVEKFGTGYGGWDVVTDTIGRESVVYSFGVGEDVSFDLALVSRYGLCVHLFDPTPRSIEWMRFQQFPEQFRFHDFGLAAVDGEIAFNPPENPAYVSFTVLDRPATRDRAVDLPVKRLPTIMHELDHRRVDILKMDIEGAEYDVIDDLCKSDIRPGQILIEFHHRFPGVGIGKTKTSVAQIKGMGYELFSVSSSGEEFGFARKS